MNGTGRLFFFDKQLPNVPIDEKYIVEIEGMNRESFLKIEDAMLFLFDHGVRQYQYLTKEIHEYKNKKAIKTYELCQIKNRIGYVIYDDETYIDTDGKVKKRKAFVWRFIGHGRPCFAPTKEELLEKVMAVINLHKEDPENRGFNTYPYYTRHYR